MITTDDYGNIPKDIEAKVRNWMRANYHEYDNSTALAEACAYEFDLYLDEEVYAIPDIIFEISLEYSDQ